MEILCEMNTLGDFVGLMIQSADMRFIFNVLVGNSPPFSALLCGKFVRAAEVNHGC